MPPQTRRRTPEEMRIGGASGAGRKHGEDREYRSRSGYGAAGRPWLAHPRAQAGDGALPAHGARLHHPGRDTGLSLHLQHLSLAVEMAPHDAPSLHLRRLRELRPLALGRPRLLGGDPLQPGLHRGHHRLGVHHRGGERAAALRPRARAQAHDVLSPHPLHGRPHRGGPRLAAHVGPRHRHREPAHHPRGGRQGELARRDGGPPSGPS